MRIIISPAKKMNSDMDSIPWHDHPIFLSKTEILCKQLQGMSYGELKAVWNCNDQIAKLNANRLQKMDLHRNLTPAILAYEGIQYQYMAPGVFTDEEFTYIQEHLRILSGFYGILRPFDGVTPYRLEMQAKLKAGECKDIYSFWGNSIAKQLFAETDIIVNLASKEYSMCISKYLPTQIEFINCIFGEEKNGKIIEKGTLCKMARGEMVRYMAEHKILVPEKIKDFDRLNYLYSEELSNKTTYVFVLNKKAH